MSKTNPLLEEIPYLGGTIKIYAHNLLPVMVPAHEFKKIIAVCNETNKTISQVIRLQTQPCCKCQNLDICYVDSEGNKKFFHRVSLNSKKRREYFTKK